MRRHIVKVVPLPISKVASCVKYSSRTARNLSFSLWDISPLPTKVWGKGSAVRTYLASKNCMGKLWVPGTEKPKASLSLMGISGRRQFLK